MDLRDADDIKGIIGEWKKAALVVARLESVRTRKWSDAFVRAATDPAIKLNNERGCRAVADMACATETENVAVAKADARAAEMHVLARINARLEDVF